MKPFNLEEAKAGKPVCTRDGKPARIICFDKKGGNYPLIALVNFEGEECAYSYTNDGRMVSDSTENVKDLLMAPEKHEGWGWLGKSSCVYTTKEDALDNAREGAFLAKVEWEE